MINTFLFDLDGTLLPLKHDEFINTYFGLIGKKFAKLGYNPELLLAAVWAGTMAMLKNDGKLRNEEVFWNLFNSMVNEDQSKIQAQFLEFYENEFDLLGKIVIKNPLVEKCINLLKVKGYKLILATNPVFPLIATRKRTLWAGLNPDDFAHITSYENSSFCKPNFEYYKEILKKVSKQPDECIMVGNDVKEDMCVEKLGMKTYLIKDNLINNDNHDITSYQQGSFQDLLNYIENLPSLV